MRTTTILLVGLPRMLVDILFDILSAEPDVTLIGSLPLDDHWPDKALALHPQFVLLGVPTPTKLPTGARHFLAHRPEAMVLAITARARHGVLYGPRSSSVPIGELSRERILAAIRSLSEDQLAPEPDDGDP